MIKIYTDAAYQPTQGVAAVAARIIVDQANYQVASYIGQVRDNHMAEFQAVKLAFEWLVQQELPKQTVVLHSDSQIVIQSLEKRYVKDVNYCTLLKQLLPLVDAQPLIFYKWIPDKENRATDLLARQTLQQHLAK